MSQFGLLCLFITLVVLAQGVSAQKCKKVDPKAQGCTPPWVMTPHPPRTCVFFHKNTKTWTEAHQQCQSKNSNHSLVSPVTLDTTKFIGNFPGYQDSWVGLNDRQTESEWTWVNGLRDKQKYWHGGEPDGHKSQNCVFIKKKWADDVCTRKRKYICQKEHEVGPRQIAMTINWHRPGFFYAGYRASVTCTSFSPVGGTIRWEVVKGKHHNPPGLTSSTEERFVLEKNDLNQCGNKTISTYSFQASAALNGMIISCFSRPPYQGETCPAAATRLAFCVASKKLTILDTGPKGRPVVKLFYKGAPDRVKPGEGVKAECSLVTGPGSNLTWLLNGPGGPVAPGGKEFKTRFKQIDHPKKGPTQVSTLKFEMTSDLDGASLTCFAHDVVTLNMDRRCRPGNVFCAETDKLKVPESSWFTLPYLGFLSILLVLLAAWAALSQPVALGTAKGEGEGGAEEAPIIVLTDEPGSTRSSRSKAKSKSISSSVKSGGEVPNVELEVKSSASIY